jgi:hypothetical protein
VGANVLCGCVGTQQRYSLPSRSARCRLAGLSGPA